MTKVIWRVDSTFWWYGPRKLTVTGCCSNRIDLYDNGRPTYCDFLIFQQMAALNKRSKKKTLCFPVRCCLLKSITRVDNSTNPLWLWKRFNETRLQVAHRVRIPGWHGTECLTVVVLAIALGRAVKKAGEVVTSRRFSEIIWHRKYGTSNHRHRHRHHHHGSHSIWRIHAAEQ